MLSRTRRGGDPRVIEKRTLKNGRPAYRVRWREAGRGSREHVRSFDRREDAVRFETDLRRRKQLGELADLSECEMASGRVCLLTPAAVPRSGGARAGHVPAC